MLCFGKSYEEKQETVIEVEMVMDGESSLFPWWGFSSDLPGQVKTANQSEDSLKAISG